MCYDSILEDVNDVMETMLKDGGMFLPLASESPRFSLWKRIREEAA